MPVLKLARVAPDVIPSVTEVLYAGPVAPRTVTLTMAWLWMLIESGLIVIAALVGMGGGGVPMVNFALLLTAPVVAVMFTIESSPAGEMAVNVTVVWPNASVRAAAEKLPAPGTLTVNVTVAPLITPNASLTVAVTVVLPPLLMVEVLSETMTAVGTRGGVPMMSWALPLIVPLPPITEAIIVATWLSPAGEAALNVVVATPEALVVTEAALKDPVTALITVKLTVTLGNAAPVESVTVAFTVAERPLLMDDGKRVT